MLSGMTSQKSIFIEKFGTESDICEDEKTEKMKNFNYPDYQNNDLSILSLQNDISKKNIKILPLGNLLNILTLDLNVDIDKKDIKIKDLNKDMLNINTNSKILVDLTDDNFCLDMGTTPLATERRGVEEYETFKEGILLGKQDIYCLLYTSPSPRD